MTVVDEINTKNALRITNAWLSEVQYKAPYFGCGDMEAIKKALEKQIPKKPKRLIGIDEKEITLCPNCNGTISGYYHHYYCGGCGQAIDWESDHLGEVNGMVKEGEQNG